MRENPYQSPPIVAEAPTLLQRREPGLFKSLLIASLLPLPVLGGGIGLFIGFGIALNCFAEGGGRPLPDLTDFGWTLTLLSGVAGFGLTALFIALAIRKRMGVG